MKIYGESLYCTECDKEISTQEDLFCGHLCNECYDIIERREQAMAEQTSDLSALWCTKCGKQVENNPYHQLGTPVYCQEHTLAEKLDDIRDTMPASNYYQELDVEEWKQEPYNMTVTLYDNMRYCVKCHKPSRFISIVTGPNNNCYISHNEFCSEVCAVEWYMDVRAESVKAGYSQQHYEVKML